MNRFFLVFPNLDGLPAIAFARTDLYILVSVDLDRLITFVFFDETDLEGVVVFDNSLKIFLRMEIDGLTIFFVFETQLIERFFVTFWSATRFQSALRCQSWQIVGRTLLAVINPTYD